MRLRHVCPVGSASSGSAVLRHRALCSEALYRPIHSSGPIVEVEVVAAPGLQPGTRVQLTAAAVAAMSSVAVVSGDRRTPRFDAARDVHIVG
jgi:hypothetical protein